MNKSIQAAIFLVVGAVLIVWGLSEADSFSGKLTSAFTGSPGDKVMMLYIGGGISIALGVFRLIK